MDNKKRIKSLLMLSLMLTSLSSCSKDDIKINSNYKIIQDYDIENENNFYLVKVNKIDLMKDKTFKIIGNFNSYEEARDYLNILIESEKVEMDYIIGQGVTLVIIGGLFYYFISNEKKSQKVLKK